MYYTRLSVLLLIALSGGCASLSTPMPGSDATSRGLSASAGDETDLYRQAITALNNSQLDLAETQFKAITKLRPEFAGPWANLALIDMQRHNLDLAQKDVAKALALNPKMPQALNILGSIEFARGNITKAVDDFRQAILLKEDYAQAHYNYALVNDIYFQDIKVAARHYKRYLELSKVKDKKTEDWVQELDRKLAKGPQ